MVMAIQHYGKQTTMIEFDPAGPFGILVTAGE